MSNQDQAAEVIGDLFKDAFLNYKGIGRDIARSLHEAGLLAPDLPEMTGSKKSGSYHEPFATN